MSARPAPLRQSDLTRYAKAMQKAGVTDWAVEVDLLSGKQTIRVGKGEGAATPAPTGWEDVE